MAVSVGGSFSIFGANNATTVAGAIVEGGADFNTVNSVNNFNDLKGLANINKFDPLYSDGATQLSDVIETIQFRGYPILECDSPTAFSGGQAYPTEQSVLLGTNTGDVELQFEANTVPDRFIVYYDNAVVIDTGYRGTLNYDFGGAQRLSFTNSLVGKIDPILTTIYPDVTNFPDDGFPRVVAPGDGTSSFFKSTTTPTIAQVRVYGPMSGTAWDYTVGCPVPLPETVGINFFNSLVKGDPELIAESVLLVTRPSNTVINNTTSITSTGSVTTETGVLHTINVTANGESGVISTGALITLSITGGVNPPEDPFLVTSTTGFLTASYTFISDPGGYILDAEVAISAPEE
jgi:hypothetical protein